MIIKITKIVLISIALAAIIVGFTAYYAYSLIRPIDPSNSHKTIFEVKTGQSSREIAAGLKQAGLVKSEWPLLVAVRFIKEPLLAGVYELSPNMSAIEIYKAIATGKTKLTKITIPEGFRVEQIAARLNEKNLANYSEFVTQASSYEGKLFPDTYNLAKDVTIKDIILSMTNNFNSRTANLNLTDEDLIIASIVEREAINDEERPLIAGIYKNRIARGMKLEADPTVQYAKDNAALLKLPKSSQKDFKFWQPITMSDYHSIISKYNTYETVGLPAGPICNPGLASIEATVNYQHHDYLYFLQHDGKIYPAKTEAEHNTNRVNVLGAKLNG